MIQIFSQTRFEGFHCWPNAPEAVGFLSVMHRHEFHVIAYKKVSHDDRDVEFILYKRHLDKCIEKLKTDHDVSHWSCERWATEIGFLADADSVMVSEDGENGAVWTKDDNEAKRTRII